MYIEPMTDPESTENFFFFLDHLRRSISCCSCWRQTGAFLRKLIKEKMKSEFDWHVASRQLSCSAAEPEPDLFAEPQAATLV